MYDTNPILSGKTYWKTKEPIMKPNLMCYYNKYMGGGGGGGGGGGRIDPNDQLLQYSAYDRCTLKWWKKWRSGY